MGRGKYGNPFLVGTDEACRERMGLSGPANPSGLIPLAASRRSRCPARCDSSRTPRDGLESRHGRECASAFPVALMDTPASAAIHVIRPATSADLPALRFVDPLMRADRDREHLISSSIDRAECFVAVDGDDVQGS